MPIAAAFMNSAGVGGGGPSTSVVIVKKARRTPERSPDCTAPVNTPMSLSTFVVSNVLEAEIVRGGLSTAFATAGLELVSDGADRRLVV
jgi:hypothetical protein